MKYIDAQGKIVRHLNITKKLDHPITIKIGTTDHCNHACPWCSEDLTAGRQHPDLFKLFDIVAPYAESLVFSGNGEPTLHPQFLDAITYAKEELGLEIGIITNGSTFQPEDIPQFQKICTWIRISLDATDPRTYAKMHGVGEDEFPKILANAKALVGGNATIGLAYLVHKNLDIAVASTLGEVRGVDYIQFRNFHGDTKDYTEAIGSRGLYKIVSDAPLPEKCYAGDFTKVIEPNGDVTWCCMMRGNPYFYMGNVYEDPDVLTKSLDVDTTKCPLTCVHRALNQTLTYLFDPQELDHGNFI